MTRIGKVQNYINSIFSDINNFDEQRAAYIHSYGVAQCCALLAARRKLDIELSTIIGLLHDVYSYKTGVHALHSHNGAEMVRVAFKYELKDIFSNEEQTIIKSAIYHHADKEHVHDEYDELLKDCDLLQHYLFDISCEYFVADRLSNVATELGFELSATVTDLKEKKVKLFNQALVGDIAEELCLKNIVGSKDNEDYMEIIKYYPESFAFDELKNAWCAAFVYHCCIKAGLTLPLRTPNDAKVIANCRFACVIAWYEWANEHGYCFKADELFIPQRGDLVVYKNIIPKGNKPENGTWCDHIGIVLNTNENTIIVAEGNVNNQNVLGIVKRNRNENIDSYIRITNNYEYKSWMIDYKTGNVKTKLYTN
jgi:5'-deoxynucleotidase YfbR-like HD superfamily hydrolase